MTPERIARLRAVLDKRQPDLSVVTDYVHKGRNLAAIIRTADAVGVSDVHCVIGDKEYRSFRGTTMGSHSWVDVHRHFSLSEPVIALKGSGFQVVAAHLSEQALDFREIDYTRPTALLLGAERVGVSDEGKQLADVHITIPMVGMVESFNVSVAAGIILCEALRQRQQAGFYQQRRIDKASYERLFFEWGHPQVRDFCLANNLTYPQLLEDGEIDEPAVWYAQVKDLLAQRSGCEE